MLRTQALTHRSLLRRAASLVLVGGSLRPKRIGLSHVVSLVTCPQKSSVSTGVSFTREAQRRAFVVDRFPAQDTYVLLDALWQQGRATHLVYVKPSVGFWVEFFFVNIVQHGHELLPCASSPHETLHHFCRPFLLRNDGREEDGDDARQDKTKHERNAAHDN